MKGKIAYIVVKKKGCKTTKLPYTVQVCYRLRLPRNEPAQQ